MELSARYNLISLGYYINLNYYIFLMELLHFFYFIYLLSLLIKVLSK